MLKQLIKQFYLTKRERYGAAALLLVALVAYLIPCFYTYLPQAPSSDFSSLASQIAVYREAARLDKEPGERPEAVTELFPFDPNMAPVETLVRLGLSERVARTIVKYRERGGKFREADDLQKIYSLPEADFERLRPYVRIAGGNKQQHLVKEAATFIEAPRPELSPFDPNTASEATLLRLGLPRPIVTRWLRYREKGGFFFEKTDVKKLYGLSENDFKRLEPYLHIAKSEVSVQPAAYAGGGFPAAAALLDVNAASVDAWQRLPGIGTVRAQKILRFRDKLGGFAHIDLVGETIGLPDSIFQKIRPRLYVETPVFRKINLNTASEEELSAHPFFSFKQARLIVAYRAQHGPYNTPADIGNIAAFTDRKWVEKVVAYLKVE